MLNRMRTSLCVTLHALACVPDSIVAKARPHAILHSLRQTWLSALRDIIDLGGVTTADEDSVAGECVCVYV